jgi:hypothetical protein
MQRLSLLGAVMVAVLGCAAVGSLTPSSTTHAIIDDVSGRPPIIAGYCITQVDGHGVERARSHVITYVPVAIVPPGKHTLTLELKDGETPTTTTVSASFVAGKRYRIRRQDDAIVVLEDEDDRHSSGIMY